MNKPRNYDNTSVGFTPVNLGGHKAVIKSVVEKQNKNGGEMIVVYIDFAADDEQPHYFSDLYRDDTRKEKKWSNNGTQYINVYDSEGNTTKSFKAFTTAFEDSNGTEVKWVNGDAWAQQFKGKAIGVVYGEEENYYNDELRTVRKIRRFCDVNKAMDAEIPQKRLYKGDMGTSTTFMPNPAGGTDFMDIDDGDTPFR